MDKKLPDHISLDIFWPYHSVVLANKVSRYISHVVRSEADLNSSQWRVLAAVMDQPGRSAADVTSVTPMDKTIVSRAVKSLLEKKVIKKTQNTSDKRLHALEATEMGVDIYKRIAMKLNASFIGELTDREENDRITRRLKEFAEKVPPIP